jgi:DnaA-homolog protein
VTQLLLDLKPEQSPTLENFVAGENAELIGRLHALADCRSYDAIYIWGPDGSGKSHLLAATAAKAAEQRPASVLSGRDAGVDIAAPPGALLAIDDVDTLNDVAQIALFRIFNAARLAGLALLLSGTEPPSRLILREDLRTRIGQTLVFEVKSLTDEEKSAALRRHALMRGMRVDEGLVRYLLNHGRRDLPSLMAVLDNLDRATLQQQRPATLPLLKEVMQLQFSDGEDNDNETGSV